MDHSQGDDEKTGPAELPADSSGQLEKMPTENGITSLSNQGSSESSDDSIYDDARDSESRTGSKAGSETPIHRNRRPALTRKSTNILENNDKEELVRIATALSRRHSVATAHGGLARVPTLVTWDEESPALDPKSDKFDLEKWLQNFVKTLREQGITARQTGVVFKDLEVSGTGAAVQVQETVASTLLAPLRIGEFISFGKKKHKRILQNFDGLIRSGELLIVLGRPGSGCSTLLKTLCGELHGLKVDHKSSIHYNGISQKLMKKEFKGEAIYNQEV